MWSRGGGGEGLRYEAEYIGGDAQLFGHLSLLNFWELVAEAARSLCINGGNFAFAFVVVSLFFLFLLEEMWAEEGGINRGREREKKINGL